MQYHCFFISIIHHSIKMEITFFQRVAMIIVLSLFLLYKHFYQNPIEQPKSKRKHVYD